MNPNLLRYLNDHLAGSAGAIGLIRNLASHCDNPEEAGFFKRLEEEVEQDRSLLKSLIEKLGESHSTIMEAAGTVTSAASRLKLHWEGLDPGHLGRLEGLEVLALGIQGKRLLWRMLAEIAPQVPAWQDISFAKLEQTAIAQRDAVDTRRLAAGKAALLD